MCVCKMVEILHTNEKRKIDYEIWMRHVDRYNSNR